MPQRPVRGVWSMNWWNDLLPHGRVAESLTSVAERYLQLADRHTAGATSLAGDAVGLVAHVLSRRVAETHWRPNGRLSANGQCRLMPTVDGQWLALNLARPGDIDIFRAVLLPTTTASDRIDPSAFERAVATWRAEELVRATCDLGVPLSRVGEVEWNGSLSDLPVHHRPMPLGSIRDHDGWRAHGPALKVLDLSSLWAGPLCSRLLRDAGHEVTTVESVQRPDPTRWRHPSFFAELHRGKGHVRLDFARDGDRLEALILDSDIVIENSRPRALRRLGIEPARFVATGRPRLWVSISGYGGDDHGDPDGGVGLRVGFGDDCAAAGGLVDWSVDGPRFVADAIADPVTGLVAATAILSWLDSDVASSGRHMQIALAECANWVVRGGGVHSHRRD